MCFRLNKNVRKFHFICLTVENKMKNLELIFFFRRQSLKIGIIFIIFYRLEKRVNSKDNILKKIIYFITCSGPRPSPLSKHISVEGNMKHPLWF